MAPAAPRAGAGVGLWPWGARPARADPPPEAIADQSGSSGLSAWTAVSRYLALALFCLLATSTFIVLELYAVCAPAASTQLAALRNWLDMHGNEVIIIVCLVLGVWLTGQGIRRIAIEGSR